MTKILMIEDDIELAGKVRDWLVFEKFTVDVAHNGADASHFLAAYQYDVIIIDWQLPDTTGLEICRSFRGRGGLTPILFLTGKDAIENKEQGLDSGADDYVTKPFHVKELSARLRALIRRTPGLQPQTITCANLELETATFKVKNEGQEIQLLPKEFALLEYLMRRPNQVFSSKALLNAVWNSDSEASEDTIRTYIKTLRKKVTNQAGECPIKTIHGLGYKIECN
jgi:two-component system OmpR family response regulator